jgi:hypothetical protein
MNPKIFKNITMLHIVSWTGRPEKNEKLDTFEVVLTGFSGAFTSKVFYVKALLGKSNRSRSLNSTKDVIVSDTIALRSMV